MSRCRWRRILITITCSLLTITTMASAESWIMWRTTCLIRDGKEAGEITKALEPLSLTSQLHSIPAPRWEAMLRGPRERRKH